MMVTALSHSSGFAVAVSAVTSGPPKFSLTTIGLATPPYGLLLFVVTSITKSPIRETPKISSGASVFFDPLDKSLEDMMAIADLEMYRDKKSRRK